MVSLCCITTIAGDTEVSSTMTPLEANALLLTMTKQRAELAEFNRQHADNWEESTMRQAFDMLYALDTQARRIEMAFPEFEVEFLEEKRCYCLIPRRTLPYRQCRTIVVMEVVTL